MNVWKLLSANHLVCEEEPVPERTEGLLRVRVTKILVDGTDAAIIAGTYKINYPFIPGRYAVGVVSESDNVHLPKGTRVLLHTYRPVPDQGTAKKDFSEDDTLICGYSQDGFLRDFVLATEDEVTPLPDSVNDEQALVAHHLALAKAAVDELNAQKGDHIAIVGGNLTGLFACQLLIYQQVSPILIDGRSDRLEFAKKCGIYYTMLPGDDLIDKIASVTGGRLAAGSVYVAGSGTEKTVPFRVCAPGSDVSFCVGIANDFMLDLEVALKKRLTVHGVTDAADYLETAINLIANRAVDLTRFTANTVAADRATENIGELAAQSERNIGELVVLNLI